jgi:hypothetical protein
MLSRVVEGFSRSRDPDEEFDRREKQTNRSRGATLTTIKVWVDMGKGDASGDVSGNLEAATNKSSVTTSTVPLDKQFRPTSHHVGLRTPARHLFGLNTRIRILKISPITQWLMGYPADICSAPSLLDHSAVLLIDICSSYQIGYTLASLF